MTTTITGAGGVSQVQAGAIESSDLPSGSVVQIVNFQTGTMATGTTTMPYDNTIPQNTEGNEYMTLTITPTSATNILIIDARLNSNPSNSSVVTGALFQDSASNAIASTFQYFANGSIGTPQTIQHKMVSGTASATTFKVRIGSHVTSTTTFNGRSGGAFYGGTLASSITITEYTP